MARNIGIDAATGEWVCFVDADDRIYPWHLDMMIEAAPAETDIVYGGITQRRGRNGSENEKRLETSSVIEALLDNDNVSAPYNVLIKRQLLKELRFNECYTYGEDAVFKLRLLSMARHVTLIPMTGYVYVRDTNNTSAVDRYHERMEDAVNEKFELMERILIQYGMDEGEARVKAYRMYYDTAVVPILTNPFHINTPLSFWGRNTRIRNNFFSEGLAATVFQEYNTAADHNPFCRLLRMGRQLHSCLMVTTVLWMFYLYKYRK